MSRDHRKLRAFALADEGVMAIYRHYDRLVPTILAAVASLKAQE